MFKPRTKSKPRPGSPGADASLGDPLQGEAEARSLAVREPVSATWTESHPGSTAAEELLRHDEELRSLQRELERLDSPSLSLRVLRAYLEEFAARARDLQDQGPGYATVTSQILRRLTARAYERGITDVFGLNRKHRGSWTTLAARARSRRDAMDLPREKGPAAGLEAPDPRRSGSEPRPPKSLPPPELSDSLASLEPPYPRLTKACQHGPVVLIGGIVKQDKVQAMRERFHIDVEWIPTRRSTNTSVASMEKRIREGRVAAIVVLHGLMAHKHFDPLVAAARQIDLPFAYADKAGLGSVARALEELERHLTRK